MARKKKEKLEFNYSKNESFENLEAVQQMALNRKGKDDEIYHHGAANRQELKNLFYKSLTIIGLMAVVLTAISLALSGVLAGIFVGYDAALFAMTKRAFAIYSLSFLASGFSIYGSSHFTALNNGLISAAISFLRALVFQSAAVLLLPLIWQLDGIWYSIVVAEVISAGLTVGCFVLFRHRYHYA